MGCNSSKPRTKVSKSKDPRDIAIERKLAPMLDPNHDLNVNKKYSYLYYLLPDDFVGQGIKKTRKYVALTNEKALEDKKNEFWGYVKSFETRRTTTMLGSPEIGLLFTRHR